MDLLVFPHQLFAAHPGLDFKPKRVVLIEDSLFFGDSRYPLRFHKQKLWFHRATMLRYQQRLEDAGFPTEYLDYQLSSKSLFDHLKGQTKDKRPSKFLVAEPHDFILERRLDQCSKKLGVEIEYLPTPAFLNTPEENQAYRDGKKRWFMADFYKWQRQRLKILVEDNEPVGGKWSFDQDNRKKIPKKILKEIPDIPKRKADPTDSQAVEYVEQKFANNPGTLERLIYPTSHEGAKQWLDNFLKHRFTLFGDYEDAIVEGESWLWHSVLTPMLNVGLITPQDIVKSTLRYADKHEVPINSLEGFIRQVIGWREFMRATYQDLGVRMRTTNYWHHQKKMPTCFYDGTTGLPPIDDTIRRILSTVIVTISNA